MGGFSLICWVKCYFIGLFGAIYSAFHSGPSATGFFAETQVLLAVDKERAIVYPEGTNSNVIWLLGTPWLWGDSNGKYTLL